MSRHDEMTPSAAGGRVERCDKCADALTGFCDKHAAEIDESKSSASVGGEVVAWQYRVKRDGGGYVDWQPWEREDRPAKIGRWDVEYRPLYAKPPALVVDDGMVERACNAYDAYPVEAGDEAQPAHYPAMHAALTVALAKKEISDPDGVPGWSMVEELRRLRLRVAELEEGKNAGP